MLYIFFYFNFSPGKDFASKPSLYGSYLNPSSQKSLHCSLSSFIQLATRYFLLHILLHQLFVSIGWWDNTSLLPSCPYTHIEESAFTSKNTFKKTSFWVGLILLNVKLFWCWQRSGSIYRHWYYACSLSLTIVQDLICAFL